MSTEKITDKTSYTLLKVNPHQDRSNCEIPFICLAKMRETYSTGDGFVEKHRVSISLNIIEASYKPYSVSGKVIKNPSFDITLSRFQDGEYSMITKHFYVDTPWARDRGLGQYMMIKILNILKSRISLSHVGELSFSLSATQGKEYDERLLRNYFYKKVGCKLKGHENNTEAWDSATDALAVIDFNKVPTQWNIKKVEEAKIENVIQDLIIKKNEMIHLIDGKDQMIEYHKNNTQRIDRYRRYKDWVVVKSVQLGIGIVILWTLYVQFI